MIEESRLDVEAKSKHIYGPGRKRKVYTVGDHDSRYDLAVRAERFSNSSLLFSSNASTRTFKSFSRGTLT